MTDLLVVGGGVMGAATALAAARRGLRTVLAERFSAGHRHGSSHGPSRIMRLSYDDGQYIELARDAYLRWLEVQHRSGGPLLSRVGGLDFGPAGLPALTATAAAMSAAHVPFTRLTGEEVAKRFPQLRVDPDTAALYQPDGAVLHADDCVAALLDEAARAGCEIRDRARVERIESGPTGVSCVINGVPVRAGAVVIAAGAWVNQLLAGTGTALPVTVTREQVAYYAVPDEAYAPGRFPVTIEHRAEHPYMISMFPELSPGGGIKLMRDRDGVPIEPEDLSGQPDPGRLDLLTRHAERRLNDLGPVRHAETCRYTLMPDGDFVLDRVPGHPDVGVLSACSGHGFKFAPVLGEMMVDLITTGDSAYDVQRFGLAGRSGG